jgi:hypothetical protein
MNFPLLPVDFSTEARANVIAAEIRASRALSSEGAAVQAALQRARFGQGVLGKAGIVIQYIMTVFAASAHEACDLGKKAGGWAADIVDREARELLRLTVLHAKAKYSYLNLSMTELISQNGYITSEAQALFEKTDEWKHYQDELLDVARIQRTQPPSRSGNEVAALPPDGDLKNQKPQRTFREPNTALLKNQDATLNRKSAAEALGISERTLDRWVDAEKLTPIGLGSRKRFKTKELLRALNQNNRDKVDKSRQE